MSYSNNHYYGSTSQRQRYRNDYYPVVPYQGSSHRSSSHQIIPYETNSYYNNYRQVVPYQGNQYYNSYRQVIPYQEQPQNIIHYHVMPYQPPVFRDNHYPIYPYKETYYEETQYDRLSGGFSGKLGSSLALSVVSIVGVLAYLGFFYLSSAPALIIISLACGIVGLALASQCKRRLLKYDLPTGTATAAMVLSIIGICFSGLFTVGYALCMGTIGGINSILESFLISL